MNKRFDIQFLRGIAVLLVVLYHANFVPISGGFLGVDVFFVISGFLITSVIVRDVDNRTFSFKKFYSRRAKRLLPATYSTLIFTSVLSYQFLTNSQWIDYIKQLVGSLTFSANMVLLFQTGYFDDSATNKPLLHMWSLSLEEQYYLILPLALFFLPKRWRTSFFTIGITTSIALCFVLIFLNKDEIIAFYTLPTRIWELLIGSLGAWLMLRHPSLNIPKNVKVTILMFMLFIAVLPFDNNTHPGIDAFFMVIGTLFLLLGKDNWIRNNTTTKSMVKIGDWSYSLYLVHWPLFAFANNVFLGLVPDFIMILIVFLSIALAYLQYTFVEQPFRYGWKTNYSRTLFWLSLVAIIVLAIPLPKVIIINQDTNIDEVNFSNIRRVNHGLSNDCEQKFNEFVALKTCMTSTEPKIAIWGDSYAMHLVHGIISAPKLKDKIVQITKSSCGPARGIAFVNFNYSKKWAQNCIDFNESAFQYLRETESIKYVVMSSTFAQYFRNLDQEYYYDGKLEKREEAIAIKKLEYTINELRKYNKIPIIVGPSPSPSPDFNIGHCQERMANNLPVYGRKDCNFSVKDYKVKYGDVIRALKEVQKKTEVEIFWPDQVNCLQGTCYTQLDDVYIYRDNGHFTVSGSEFMIHKMGLIDRLSK